MSELKGLRRFFQYHVRVRSAYAERAYSGAARRAIRLPLRQACVDTKRAVLKVDLRVRLLKV
jgi:hypothetical protein